MIVSFGRHVHTNLVYLISQFTFDAILLELEMLIIMVDNLRIAVVIMVPPPPPPPPV